MKELEVPPAAQEDLKSPEVLRLWVAKGGEWVSINPYPYRNRDFKEEWAWGVFLSDAIKHIANAISELSDKDKQQVIDDIRKSFEAELSKPTSEVRGGILQSEPEEESRYWPHCDGRPSFTMTSALPNDIQTARSIRANFPKCDFFGLR